jgi:hypothetical protein
MAPRTQQLGQRLSEALYRLTAMNYVIGEALVGIIDRSFIQDRPLDCASRSGKHESW